MCRVSECVESELRGLMGKVHNSKQLCYTGCLQMNGAVSKVNKKFISHLTRAKHTPLAVATAQVSRALPAVRSLVLTAGLWGMVRLF